MPLSICQGSRRTAAFDFLHRQVWVHRVSSDFDKQPFRFVAPVSRCKSSSGGNANCNASQAACPQWPFTPSSTRSPCDLTDWFSVLSLSNLPTAPFSSSERDAGQFQQYCHAMAALSPGSLLDSGFRRNDGCWLLQFRQFTGTTLARRPNATRPQKKARLSNALNSRRSHVWEEPVLNACCRLTQTLRWLASAGRCSPGTRRCRR